MYCDPILWKNVRDCVLEDGISRRGAARKFGLARNTVRKMLLDELPPPREKRTRRRPMIGPHEATITRMVKERSRSGYGYSPRIRRIFEFISNEENYRGSYSAVRDATLWDSSSPCYPWHLWQRQRPQTYTPDCPCAYWYGDGRVHLQLYELPERGMNRNLVQMPLPIRMSTKL